MAVATQYSAIFDWNMEPEEAEVYKIAVTYEEEFLKFFAGTDTGRSYRANSIPKTGDPRKSNIFRQCWRLRRETRGLLQPEEYRLYIRANLCILKLNKAYVSPNAVCGDKAWMRWKVWERWYKNKLSDLACKAPSVGYTNPKVVKEIDRTKRFLFEKCEGQPTKEKILDFVESGIFKFWVLTGKITQYYVVCSPFLKEKVKELSDACSFDPKLAEDRINSEIRQYFEEEFRHEF